MSPGVIQRIVDHLVGVGIQLLDPFPVQIHITGAPHDVVHEAGPVHLPGDDLRGQCNLEEHGREAA